MDKYEHVGGLSSMDKFMEMEEILMDESEDVIVSLGLLDLKDANNKI
jgi:thermostable 8-oxoguanine DNA glycosylase